MGSFLNVVICRMPANQSVIYPSSHCPICGYQLAWLELIPLVSYLLQRGTCRECAQPISIQYPLVELLTGLVYLFLYTQYGLSNQLLTAMIFASLLIPIIYIDLMYQIIPDTLNAAGAALGLLNLVVSHLTLTSALLGAVVGGSIMLVIAVISRGGMGGGDIKMVTVMGLFLGLKFTFVALFLSFIIGGLGSLLLIICGLKHRKDFIPFGPFLAIGGFAAYVFGNEILAWYFQRFFY
jgi:leader peptidase (prepilin peptidase) / N-methyltransferase